jgi:hypothetical protein
MRLDVVAINTRLDDAQQRSLERGLRDAVGEVSVQPERIAVRVEGDLTGPTGGPAARCRIEVKLAEGRWLRAEAVGPKLRAAVEHAVRAVALLLRRVSGTAVPLEQPVPTP